jgi:hypothetical protein
MVQFRRFSTSFTLCWPSHDHDPSCQWGKQFPVEATEWIGTGLAIQRLCHQSRLQEYYGIMHVQSGRLITGTTLSTVVNVLIGIFSYRVNMAYNRYYSVHSCEGGFVATIY